MELNEGSLKEFAKAAASGERLELRSPIKEADYKAHAGAVYGLDCSPFQVRITGGGGSRLGRGSSSSGIG